MKFKYNQTEEGDVEIRLKDGRNVTVIMHECGELDYEGDWDKLTEDEADKLINWVCEKFSHDTNEYEETL
jgi:hypothetical protein